MQGYLEEAEKDKERYMKELEEYQQTDAYKNFVARQKAMKKSKEKKIHCNPTHIFVQCRLVLARKLQQLYSDGIR